MMVLIRNKIYCPAFEETPSEIRKVSDQEDFKINKKADLPGRSAFSMTSF